jgi:phenylalanyl-tRNA synthetase alpha chain
MASDLLSQIEALEGQAMAAVKAADSLAALVEVDNAYLSKKGQLSLLLRGLKDVSNEERPRIGAKANEVKAKVEGAIQTRRIAFESVELEARLIKDRIDVTLPGVRGPQGSLHPVTKVLAEMNEIFARIGFDVAHGPEADTEFNNFDALNIPADHPARDMQDTFYLESGKLLRTQTSTLQIRSMLKQKPPLRIICPGAVYRSDYDITHSPMFHQVEGLYVDKNVSFAELKGCLEYFAREMFGAHTKIRLRPSFFPFVEPGAEVDVTCVQCKGKGCRVCKDTGWLEILGAGMVHPNVFKAVGYDPGSVTGFAFGIGVERVAMLKYGIPDLRLLFENDLRFLKQFGS